MGKHGKSVRFSDIGKLKDTLEWEFDQILEMLSFSNPWKSQPSSNWDILLANNHEFLHT